VPLFILIASMVLGAVLGGAGGAVLVGALGPEAAGPVARVVMGLSVAVGAVAFAFVGLLASDFDASAAAVGPARTLVTVVFAVLGGGAGLASFAVLSVLAPDLGPRAAQLFGGFLILAGGLFGLSAGRRIAASSIY
jgi:hypothetical protein